METFAKQQRWLGGNEQRGGFALTRQELARESKASSQSLQWCRDGKRATVTMASSKEKAAAGRSSNMLRGM